MKLARQVREIPYDNNSVVTVGSFDGMHQAHQQIIREVVTRAKARKGRSVLITFDPHPREVVGEQRGIEILTTLAEKQEIAEAYGVDVFFTITFDYEFSRLTSRKFYAQYLVDGIGVAEVVEGFDHHFGRDREGSVQEMKTLGAEMNFSSVAINQVLISGEPVNSTSIRRALIEGQVERAASFLGRPYSMDGIVATGNKRGRTLGFPTANLQPLSSKKVIPKNGIYFVRGRVGGDSYFGIASVGVRPTFETNGSRMVEVYLLDWDSDVYGKTIRVQFERRLRDEQRFGSADELIRQMNIDKQQSLELRAQYKASPKS